MESVVSLCLARIHTQKELCVVLQVNLCSQQGLPCIKPAMLRTWGCHWQGAARDGLPPIRCKWVTCTELIKPEIYWSRQACSKTSSSLHWSPVTWIRHLPCQAQPAESRRCSGGWHWLVAGQGRVASLLPQDSAGAMPWLGAQVQSRRWQVVVKEDSFLPGDLCLLLCF